MRKLFILCSILFCSILTYSQSTNVTATVISLDGYPYAGGSVSASLVSRTGDINCTLYKINTTPMGTLTTPCFVQAVMNNSGVFSMVLTDDHKIFPIGTLWAFTVCSQVTGACSTSSQDVFGTSINLTTLINNTLPPIVGSGDPQPIFNADTEVGGSSLGSTYYNFQDQTLHYCWTLPCSTSSNWKSIGSGSSNIANGIAGNVPVYSSINGVGPSSIMSDGGVISGVLINQPTVGGTALTLQTPDVTGVALNIPLGKGTIIFNTLTTTSNNPAAHGTGRFGPTDAIEYGCASCNPALTSTGSTDMMLIRGNGVSGPTKVCDYLGCALGYGPAGSQMIGSGQSANSDLDGELTMSGGTGTYTFINVYTTHPVCTANSSTNIAAVKVTYTGVASVTFTTSGGSDIVEYHCDGRN